MQTLTRKVNPLQALGDDTLLSVLDFSFGARAAQPPRGAPPAATAASPKRAGKGAKRASDPDSAKPAKRPRARAEKVDPAELNFEVQFEASSVQKLFDDSVRIGQRVTAKFKQVTIMLKKSVLKGPFLFRRPGTVARLKAMCARYALFANIGVNTPEMQLVAVDRSNGEFDEEIVGDAWVKFASVADRPAAEWVCGEPELQINGWTGCVVERKSTGIENGAHITEDEWRAHPEALETAVLYLMVRYAMRIGDCGMWNLLVRYSDFKVFMIDYEEERGTDFDEATWQKVLSPRGLTKSMSALIEEIVFTRPSFARRWADFVSGAEQAGAPFREEALARIADLFGVRSLGLAPYYPAAAAEPAEDAFHAPAEDEMDDGAQEPIDDADCAGEPPAHYGPGAGAAAEPSAGAEDAPVEPVWRAGPAEAGAEDASAGEVARSSPEPIYDAAESEGAASDDQAQGDVPGARPDESGAEARTDCRPEARDESFHNPGSELSYA
jgi:hypothetical protein